MSTQEALESSAVVEDKLDTVLQQLGAGGCAGRREGQVHATISRVGLMNGFKHYLTHKKRGTGGGK